MYTTQAGSQIVNLTPHAITVRGRDGETTFPPSGEVARVTSNSTEQKDCLVTRPEGVLRVPVVYQAPGTVEGLPGPKVDTIFLVSAVVLSACQGRRDVFAPDTSPTGAVRDDQGRIIAVRGLVAPANHHPVVNLDENPPDDEE